MEMMKHEEKTERQSYYRDEYGRPHQPLEKEEEEEEEDSPKSSICCLQGCLAATAVGFSFFVALPTGILLVVYASNKNDVPLISVGAVLVSLPLIMLIIVIVLCFNQRRLARLGKNRVNSAQKRKTLSQASSSSSSSSSLSKTTTVMTTACDSGKKTMHGESGSTGGTVSETVRF